MVRVGGLCVLVTLTTWGVSEAQQVTLLEGRFESSALIQLVAQDRIRTATRQDARAGHFWPIRPENNLSLEASVDNPGGIAASASVDISLSGGDNVLRVGIASDFSPSSSGERRATTRADLYSRFIYTGPSGRTLMLSGIRSICSTCPTCVTCRVLYRLVDYTRNLVLAERGLGDPADEVPLSDGHQYGLEVEVLGAATSQPQTRVEFSMSVNDATISSAGPPLPAAPRDFNVDGHPDVLIRSERDGMVAILYLEGPLGNQAIRANAITQFGENDWRLVGSGDFDNDGHPDVLFQRKNQLAVLYLGRPHGNAALGVAALDPGEGWIARTTGDFNHDGRVDILLQDPATNQLRIRFLGGRQGNETIMSRELETTLAPKWTIVAAGDVDLDGTLDVLAQHEEALQLAVVYLAGPLSTGVRASALISSAGVPGWRVSGAADLNLDGRLDVLWQNENSPKPAAIWYLGGEDGTTVSEVAWLFQSGVSPWNVNAR